MANSTDHSKAADLLKTQLDDIRLGSCLLADTINSFFNIFTADTEFEPYNVYVAGGLQTVTPVPPGQRFVQIMPGSVYSDRADVVSHYICTYYDGTQIHVYDSFNTRSLTPIQEQFIAALFPHNPPLIYHRVQQQLNGTDCGFFAIAFAISVAFGRDPHEEKYDVTMFAQHLRNVFQSNRISPFPTFHSSNELTSSTNNSPQCVRKKFKPSLSPLKKTQHFVFEKPNECSDISPIELNVPAVPNAINPPLVTAVNSQTVSKGGRPKKKKAGRPKSSSKSREEQHRDAVKKYATTHPTVNKKSVKKYAAGNPHIHQAAVKTYESKNSNKISENRLRKRNVPGPLQHFTCIGDRSGGDLLEVPVYNLKNNCLWESCFHCSHCNAPLFEEERSRAKWCCGEGSYIPTEKIPPIDASFYSNKSFLKDIRSYNNIFAFSALGVSGGFQGPPDNRGVSLIKIQGRVYHRVFDLSYKESINNGALYIDDGIERQRLGSNRNLSSSVINEITTYLNRVNPFVHLFRRLHEHASDKAHIVFEPTSRKVHGPVLGDRPTVSEVAALVRSEGEFVPKSVVVWKEGESKPHTVPYLHPAYEPLQYVLLYPHGSPGWSPELTNADGRKITQVKYYRYLILSEARFAAAGRLFQEWACDMYSRTEEERLQFLKNSQKKVLRVATRAELDETIAGEGGVAPGKVYLPSSFTHGPRYMRLKYQDGMAIVCRLGKPSFFLTVTCNASWPEITSSLLPGQSRVDRPDLCCRVFKLKLDNLIRLISSGALFGQITYILYVIEFQKRGLPHAHITFRVQGGGPTQSADIDRFIRATIPPPDEADGRLRELVLRHMVHGPCGIQKPNAPCLDKDTHKCTKHFPKKVSDVTHIDDKGFVHYARSNSNTATLDNGKSITDEWIVPYNPALMLIMDSHCNLELSSSRKIIKYLFKYIHKGPDHANVSVTQTTDEIEGYVTMRYISASEALWRFFEFDICYRRPTVIPLPVHLPQKDNVIFQPGSEDAALQSSVSLLSLYFQRPNDPELASLKYEQFFEQFIIENKKRKSDKSLVYEYPDGKHFLYKRERGQCVSRIHWISPSLGELYFLRMLLQRFPSNSFKGCRSVNEVEYDSFQEAAVAQGILEDDGEFKEAMREAAGFKTGRGLRVLFFSLIMHGAPAVIIWNEFKHALAEDYLEQESSEEVAYTRALCDLDRMLRLHGKCLVDFGLPRVIDDTTEVGRELLRWDRERNRVFVDMWLDRLCVEQRKVYDNVLSLLKDLHLNSIKALFLDGPGGSGKTLLLNVVTSKCRELGLIVLCCASTGIAALNHEGGTTAHSLFHLPIDGVGDQTTWGISNNSERAALLREASVIIWDEAPMANRYHIECVDKGMRDLTQINNVFGGKIFILAGDFRQIPPIVADGGRQDVLRACIKSSTFWRDITVHHLSISQRCKGDQSYADFIMQVGNGEAPHVTDQAPPLIALSHIEYVESLDDLTEFVYPSDVISDPEKCCRRAILSGTNRNIAEINSFVLDKLPGESFHLLSADSVLLSEDSPDVMLLQNEILNSISHPGAPDHDLVLKKNCVVILIRNLSFANKLVNGTKLIVIGISKKLIEVRLPGHTDTVFIPRIPFKFSTGRSGIEMVRRQFPLKLAYGMTINKAQGQTIDLLGVDLRSPVFSHGQLYVALGRVRSANTIKVLIPAENILNSVAHTVNIVDSDFL